MGKEPAHFVRLFQGALVVHSGGKASAFKNRAADTPRRRVERIVRSLFERPIKLDEVEDEPARLIDLHHRDANTGLPSARSE